MKVLSAIFLFTMMLCIAGRADDFAPPEAYPMNRYESGWQRNPFTLKTAPPVIQRDSFAKDLTLGSVLKNGDETTVTVVNTKTNARTHFHNNEDGPDGVHVKSVHLDTRKNTSVDLEQGTESATVRYDEKYLLSQVARSQTAMPGARPGMPGVPGAPGGIPPSGQPPGMGGSSVSPPMGGGNTTGTSPFPTNRPTLPNPSAGRSYVPTPARRMMNTAPVSNPPR